MSVIIDGTDGITFPDGVIQAVGGAVTMYDWKVNLTADSEPDDETVTSIEGIGTGLASTSLAAGDEIVIEIGEIHVESADTSHGYFRIGITDGTNFFSGIADTNGDASYGTSVLFNNSSQAPSVLAGNSHALSSNAAQVPLRMIFGQKAYGLATSSLTWKLAFEKVAGSDGVVLGSSAIAKWAIGIRSEVAA